jgi:glycosyltransferase involved in cell wall biosynthesis
MRKYLFIAANEGAKWGGSEMLWSLAAERLVCGGNEVRVSVKDWGETIPQIEHLRAAGCKVVHRRAPAILSRLARRVLPLADYSRTHIRKFGSADLVVISQGGSTDGLIWIEAVRAAGLKYAIVAQAAAEQWWPEDEVAERLAVGYEGARRAYFVSQANVNLCRCQFASLLRNAQVVRNPFNVRYDARPAWPSASTEDMSLACVSRLDTSHKGQDILLGVLNLPRWRERRIRVSFVGTGVHERGLRRNVERLGLTNVEFTGHEDDIEAVWSRHHALVLASRYEGLPLALVEAMLCGRAAVVTDVAGHKELVRDGVNGFLAKAPTVESLDEAMNRAWMARDQLRVMGERAASDVRNWVGKDPAADFTRELENLADGNNEH